MKARRRAAPRCRARRAPLRTRRRAPVRGKRPSRKTVTGPIIPLTSSGGEPPSYFELLQEAVLTLKDAHAGASLPEIRRQLQRRYKGRFDQAGDKLLTTALQRLAERGKVIYKRGYRFQFNAPKVSKAKQKSSESSPSDQSSYSGATSGSMAMSGSGGPSDATSHTSESYSESATSGTKDQGNAAKDGEAAPKDGKGKSSSGEDASSTAPESASSTASRGASSSKKR